MLNPKPKSELMIQEWLITQIADETNVDPLDIDSKEPFANYGLSSIIALRITGMLEDWTNLELPAYVLWEYPTIKQLSKYLAETLSS